MIIIGPMSGFGWRHFTYEQLAISQHMSALRSGDAFIQASRVLGMKTLVSRLGGVHPSPDHFRSDILQTECLSWSLTRGR